MDICLSCDCVLTSLPFFLYRVIFPSVFYSVTLVSFVVSAGVVSVCALFLCLLYLPSFYCVNSVKCRKGFCWWSLLVLGREAYPFITLPPVTRSPFSFTILPPLGCRVVVPAVGGRCFPAIRVSLISNQTLPALGSSLCLSPFPSVPHFQNGNISVLLLRARAVILCNVKKLVFRFQNGNISVPRARETK